ncbi:hypothetical protein FHS31_000664 [Sphingomonas vulcanisoli]|uniref:Uncharacterized protein n=1 Tax=Sphingomonas vulcanisoli TaxID=1658060 RepID=A0ABX0TNK7_9SPHN|nr:hypothetical protein [Sphingomonas vulcanisoli]
MSYIDILPIADGEGDRSKSGGGEMRDGWIFPSTVLRTVPLPTLRAGRM